MQEEAHELAGIGKIVERRSKRAKRIRLTIDSRNQIVVTRPWFMSQRQALQFVRNHRNWIQKRLSKRPRLMFEAGTRVSCSRVLSEQVSEDLSPSFTIQPTRVIVSIPEVKSLADSDIQEFIASEIIKVWRKDARTYLPQRARALSDEHSLPFNELRLKNLKSRWGSCSSKNNINLNIQLMRLEPELIDHVILHELCHTKALNHSAKFWNLFTSIDPQARQTRKTLKSHPIL